MHSDRAADDNRIPDEFPNLLARIGHRDRRNLGFIHPDPAFATSEDRSSQTLLQLQPDAFRKAENC
jgi:hypothetical protein